MKLYTCVDHDGFYPVPTASIVIGNNKREGKKMLDLELIKAGLFPFKTKEYTLIEINPEKRQAIILSDGNY